MKKFMNPPMTFLMMGIGIALIPLFFLSFFNRAGAQLEKAQQSYLAGEQATTYADRQQDFNNALTIYTQFEKEYDPIMGNGKLYYNIGNSYFQLGQYPLSVYYYYQAQELMPRNHDVTQNLKIALSKLELQPAVHDSVFRQIFFFHTYLSLPERLELFSLVALIALICISIYIWWPKTWLTSAIALFSLVAAILFLSLCYTRYFEPINGVITHSSSLYRDTGLQYAKVREEPVPAGTKVEVLDVLLNGTWLKILVPNGTLGYVPAVNMRLLRS